MTRHYTEADLERLREIGETLAPLLKNPDHQWVAITGVYRGIVYRLVHDVYRLVHDLADADRELRLLKKRLGEQVEEKEVSGGKKQPS